MRSYVRQGAVVAATAVASFALFWGLRDMGAYQRVTRPVKTQILKIPGVTAVQVIAKGTTGQFRMVVSLSPSSDLEASYHAIVARTGLASGPGSITLVIADRTDAKLEAALRDISFPLEEGIVTGHLTTMRQEILQIASTDAVQAAVEVDGQHLFVKLKDGVHYRYQITRWKGGA